MEVKSNDIEGAIEWYCENYDKVMGGTDQSRQINRRVQSVDGSDTLSVRS